MFHSKDIVKMKSNEAVEEYMHIHKSKSRLRIKARARAFHQYRSCNIVECCVYKLTDCIHKCRVGKVTVVTLVWSIGKVLLEKINEYILKKAPV